MQDYNRETLHSEGKQILSVSIREDVESTSIHTLDLCLH